MTDSLLSVTFRDSGLNPEYSEVLHDGVAALWGYVEPYAQEHDLCDKNGKLIVDKL